MVFVPAGEEHRFVDITEDLSMLDQRYSRSDFEGGWDDGSYADAVMILLRPQRWIAWADWD